MASRTLFLLLLSICIASLAFAAPISHADSSLAFGALLAERSASTTSPSPAASSSSSRKTTATIGRFFFLHSISRVLRLDKSVTGFFSSAVDASSSASERQAPAYYLEPSLGLIETSVDLRVFPVFAAGSRDKRVTADHNGDLLTVTYGGNRFVPVWARPWTSRGFRGALRFSQGLAVFILGSSLGMALVCAYWRSLCAKQEQLEICDLTLFERRMEESSHDKPDEEESIL